MNKKKVIGLWMAVILVISLATGCSVRTAEVPGKEGQSENIIITETGEILEREQLQDNVVKENEVQKQTPKPKNEQQAESDPGAAAAPEIITPDIELVEPEQEQVITDEDQTNPQGYELQLVFLGDSIFDNNRDGTGVPYLTSQQCEADVYNLAIGGTSATIEEGEHGEWSEWTSRSLCGVVNALMGRISTDVFEGTRTKEILDNPDIDFTQTDYFIIEYGLNDFFRGVPQNNLDSGYDLKTYAGALRFAVDNLRELAPGATIILCSPNYAQFYSGNWMVGDGNSLNNGNGTLFDYKGTCEYVSNEKQTLFFDAYLGLGITTYTADDYLEDGVHLTQAGRELYADALARTILGYEETKND